jgi:chorismate mutase/prephenate dehydratase
MFSGKLYITAMTDIAVTQDLIGLQGSTPENIKTVISHPQALAQCAAYIEAHGFETREYSNTALAAKHISEMGDPTVGAIASAEAARVFGLKVVEHNINASRTNTTRFGVFSRTENAFPDGAKGVQTIFMFTVRNEAGALAKALDIIGNYKLNMRSLKSRPMKELLWQYYFYVEAEGNLNTDEGKRMFKELSECCDMLKTVGSFTMN